MGELLRFGAGSVCGGGASEDALEEAIEEGDLGEAGGVGDVDDGSAALAQFVAGGLESELVEEIAEGSAGVGFE